MAPTFNISEGELRTLDTDLTLWAPGWAPLCGCCPWCHLSLSDDDVIISDHCCHVTSVSAGSRHTLLGSAELDSAPMLQPSRWQEPGQYRPIRDRCWGQPANQRRLRGEGTILGAAIDRIPARLLREQRPVTASGGWEEAETRQSRHTATSILRGRHHYLMNHRHKWQ